MKVKYFFDGSNRIIEMENNAEILEPIAVENKDSFKVLSEALSNPLNSLGYDEFLEDKKKILIIVNDGTRPTPTAQVLSFLEEKLKNKVVTILVATGTHRAMEDFEKKKILGQSYNILKNCIVSHDSKNKERLVYIGKSRNSTELFINKAVYENDGVIVIGSVEPHYFAGYTGGRKSIMPGIAGFVSIEMNHKLALSEEARVLNLESNPVHQDMMDTLNYLKDVEIFSIQVAMDKNHNVYSAFSGNINESFYKAVEVARKIFAVPIKEKADIVVTVAKDPMDINFYQSQKALDNAKFALKENGIIILVSACKEGIGSEAFYDLMVQAKSPNAVLGNIKKNYKLGYHKSGKIAQILLNTNVFVVSSLENKIFSDIFFQPFKSLEEALAVAYLKKGLNSKVIFMVDGGITVPEVNDKFISS